MMKKIFFILIFIFSRGLCAADSDLNSAFKNYQNGDFESSKKVLEQAIQTQPHNSYLIYNLGLTEYKLGKAGMAMALWRKALSLNPNISEARKAINFAITQMQTKPLSTNVDSSMDWIEKIITERISINVLWPILLISLALLFKLMFQYIGARKRAFLEDQPMPGISSHLILHALFFAIMVVLTTVNVADKIQSKATVITSQVQAKTGPANEDAALFDLPEGTELLLYEKNGSWYKIEDPSGREGWVNEAQIYVTSEKFL